MDSLTLKITHNNDTRKISCPLEGIYAAITERFGKECPGGLWFKGQMVGLDEIRDLAALTPGKALKLEMRYDESSTDDSFSDQDQEEPIAEDPKLLKQQAKAAREAAKAAKNESMQAEKLAKQEAKAAKQAEKAVLQAEKKAARQARQAEKAATQAKKAGNKTSTEDMPQPGLESIPGKMLNVTTKNAITGELSLLPCGRVCFQVDSHPGNLRVTRQHQLQKKGGRGPWAQFSATPLPEDPTVFRMQSAAHSVCFLGVLTPDESEQDPEMTLMGGMRLALVDSSCSEGLWSFYPQGAFEPLTMEAPTPVPTAREVYSQLQEMVGAIAANTGLPMHVQDAPEDEAQVIQMLNTLHEYLPHPLKRIAMKKIGLRQFETEEPAPNQEWDMMVEDLKDMGFASEDENRRAVQEANGDLKQAIKTLVQASRQ
eukprot:TRINITY_DN272_c0_g1_i1.p1 TRINITY_DN272_c0_g1~~TRINITY_DN272_c0_g1_i1.p1  ORF type:complete len:427 (-),score=147.21 TRINITY_DN272_c0_g1_i1:329-1609(-)